MANYEKITLAAEGEEAVDFYVLETTRLGGIDYYLVSTSEEDDGDACIIKDVAETGAEESIFQYVVDDTEFDAVADVFDSLMEDTDFNRD